MLRKWPAGRQIELTFRLCPLFGRRCQIQRHFNCVLGFQFKFSVRSGEERKQSKLKPNKKISLKIIKKLKN